MSLMCYLSRSNREKMVKIRRKMEQKLKEKNKKHFAVTCSSCGKLISLDNEGQEIYEKGYMDGWNDFELILSQEMNNGKEN